MNSYSALRFLWLVIFQLLITWSISSCSESSSKNSLPIAAPLTRQQPALNNPSYQSPISPVSGGSEQLCQQLYKKATEQAIRGNSYSVEVKSMMDECQKVESQLQIDKKNANITMFYNASMCILYTKQMQKSQADPNQRGAIGNTGNKEYWCKLASEAIDAAKAYDTVPGN